MSEKKNETSQLREEDGRTQIQNKVVSKEAPVNHYEWGNHCEGWDLLKQDALSVKLEKMPPYTAEMKHFHRHSQQFFFILKGKAVFEIDDMRLTVKANQGISIKPLQVHKVINESNGDLEFILSSQPAVSDDRINCE